MIHALVHESHAAACDGWNKTVMISMRSWEDGEDPSEARRSCGGTKAHKFG